MQLESTPVLYAMTALGAIAWVVAFAGSIAASSDIDFFPKFTWWGLVFQLIVTVGVPLAVLSSGKIDLYRSFLLCCIVIAFVYTSNSANNFVYYTKSSTAAASAGFILLSMVNFCWLFWLGTTDEVVQSVGIQRQRTISLGSKLNSGAHGATTTVSTSNLALNQLDSPSNEIRGLENIELSTRPSESEDEGYPVLVRGIYDYNASPDDANELSFKRGEMLRVENTLGNWWLGRNSRGEVGMCPSNYLEIV